MSAKPMLVVSRELDAEARALRRAMNAMVCRTRADWEALQQAREKVREAEMRASAAGIAARYS